MNTISTHRFGLITASFAFALVFPTRAADLDPTPVGTYGSGGAWGICVSGNRAYLAIPQQGLEIVDVSNPAEPYLLGTYEASAPVWDVAVAGDFAYLAAEAAGLIVLKVSDPGAPVRVGGYNTSGSSYDVFLAGNLAYVADGEAGVVVLDVSDPTQPRRVSGLGGSGEVHQVVVAGDYAYLADRFWNGIAEMQPYGALRILNVSNPGRPVLVASHPTEGQAWHLAVSGNLAYVSANADERLEVWDVADPINSRRIGSYDKGGALVLEGNRVLLASFQSGLHILDVSDPANLARMTGATCAGYARGIAVAGRYAYVSAQGSGTGVSLQIFDLGAPVEPTPPSLAVVRSDDILTLTWAASVEGYELESSDALAPTPKWQPEPTVPEIVGDQNVVTIEIGAGSRFFRLRKP